MNSLVNLFLRDAEAIAALLYDPPQASSEHTDSLDLIVMQEAPVNLPAFQGHSGSAPDGLEFHDFGDMHKGNGSGSTRKGEPGLDDGHARVLAPTVVHLTSPTSIRGVIISIYSKVFILPSRSPIHLMPAKTARILLITILLLSRGISLNTRN